MGASYRHRDHEDQSANCLIELYHDESAHPDTRGSAIFVLNTVAQCCEWEPQKKLTVSLRVVCEHALWNMDNPYDRAGACWLAETLGGFDERLRELAEDTTPSRCCGTVASHVNLD